MIQNLYKRIQNISKPYKKRIQIFYRVGFFGKGDKPNSLDLSEDNINSIVNEALDNNNSNNSNNNNSNNNNSNNSFFFFFFVYTV